MNASIENEKEANVCTFNMATFVGTISACSSSKHFPNPRTKYEWKKQYVYILTGQHFIMVILPKFNGKVFGKLDYIRK